MIHPLEHVLFMPDGNRRYARREGMSYRDCYELAIRHLWHLMKYTMLDKGVPEVSVVALWDYNLNRTGKDLDDFLDSASELLFRKAAEDSFFIDNGVSVRVYGELDEVYRRHPNSRDSIQSLNNLGDRVSQETKSGRKLNILYGYSSEKELQRAFATLTAEGLSHVQITFEMIRRMSFSSRLVNLAFVTGQFEIEEQDNPFTYLAQPMLHMKDARLFSLRKYFPELTTDDVKRAIGGYAQMEREIRERMARGL